MSLKVNFSKEQTAIVTNICANVHQITRAIDYKHVLTIYPDSMELQRVIIEWADVLETTNVKWDGEWMDTCEIIARMISAGLYPARRHVRDAVKEARSKR